eukprot:Blabericola_migrator_1__6050@NODE_304_length_10122_cov_30_576131_g248_i0_p1_GENE_NODE_304_length_10122_cov_30_576131_g248_i0NODE_304_length_10122_cov_30_576131_g248_i0_p1_ORF_typecomplete_len2159_score470_72Sec7/PF01369_20/3_4e03Sec7/PF01369_20/8_9e47Sec7_N/PF12783_7/2_9e03Sec7_N/PF12783_7/3_3e18Sec7_N/PF12783_7/1_3e03Sec7_N/PF12783_7/7_7e03Sec7_N/PF12783_7/1_3e03Sec7_N/PF12783_7/1_8e04DCB/PF16213_5/3_3e14DCB/PF16213_5/9_6e03DCB/PF16213_5/2_3e02DUF1981/PF09324_10/1_3e04DUF1981/PF09324_10/2_2e02D
MPSSDINTPGSHERYADTVSANGLWRVEDTLCTHRQNSDWPERAASQTVDTVKTMSTNLESPLNLPSDMPHPETPLRQPSPDVSSPLGDSSPVRSHTSPSPSSGKRPASGGTPSINGQSLTLALKRSPNLVRTLQDLMQITTILTSVLGKVVSSNDENQRGGQLSLDLLTILLSKKGNLIKHTSAFVELLRSHLIHILLKASISSSNKFSITASTLFTSLVNEFRKNLIMETAFFIESVFMKLFGTSSSPFELKMRLLKFLAKIITDCQTLQRLYLHYDTSVNRPPIVRKLFMFLHKVLGSSASDLGCTSPAQLAQLRDSVCELLSRCVSSLLEWLDSVSQMVCRNPMADFTVDSSVTIQMDVPDWLHTQAVRYIRDGGDDFEYKLKGLSPQETEPQDAMISHAKSPIADLLNGKGVAFEQRFARRLLLRQVLHLGLNDFQVKPDKGYAKLWTLEVLPRSASHLADFILNSEMSHDKGAIGGLLGEPSSECGDLLKAILEKLNFAGEEIDIALRNFLKIFRLPGEAQKIDRIVEAFSFAYSRDNPDHPCFGVGLNEDGSPMTEDEANLARDLAYIVAFSTILLHTDAHSREIKPENRMTKEEFVKNNQGVTGGHKIPTELLEKIFDRVVAEEWMLDIPKAAGNTLVTSRGQSTDSTEPEQSSLYSGALVGLGLGGGNRRKQQAYQHEVDKVFARIDQWASVTHRKQNPPPVEKDGWREAGAREKIALLPVLMRAMARYMRAALNVYLEKHSSDMETPTLITALDGLLALARLTARLHLDQEKDEILATLAIRTELFQKRAALKSKQCLALSRLLLFMHSDVEAVGRGWSVILPCLSEIDRVQSVSAKGLLIKASLAASTGHYAGSLPPNITCYNGLLPPRWMEMPAIKAAYEWWESTPGQVSRIKRVETTPAVGEEPSPLTRDSSEPLPRSRRVSSSGPLTMVRPNRAEPPKMFVRWPLGPRFYNQSPFVLGDVSDPEVQETWQDTALEVTPTMTAANASYYWVDELKSAEVMEAVMGEYCKDTSFVLPQRLSFDSLLLFFHYYLQVSSRELKASWDNQYGFNETNIKHYLPRGSSVAQREFSPADRSTRLGSLHRILDLVESLLTLRTQQEVEAVMKSFVLPHLHNVALHPDQTVALCACDVLKQIIMSVLDSHPTLDQVLFLSPFPTIFSESSELTREFLIKVIFNLVKTRGNRLTTGWSCLLDMLADKIPTAHTVHQYDLRDTSIATRERLLLGFKTLESSVDLYAVSLLSHFTRLIQTLSAYVKIFIPFSTQAQTSQTFVDSQENDLSSKDEPLDKLSAQALSIVHGFALIVSCDSVLAESGRNSGKQLIRHDSHSALQHLCVPKGLLKLDAYVEDEDVGGSRGVFCGIHAIVNGPGSLTERRHSVQRSPQRHAYIKQFIEPILLSVADTIQAPSITLNLRWKSVDILFSILESGGSLIFDELYWHMVFENLLLPLFESLLSKLDARSCLVELDHFFECQDFMSLSTDPPLFVFAPHTETSDSERLSSEWASRTATLLFRSVLSLLMTKPVLANNFTIVSCLLKILGLFWTATAESVARIGLEMFESMVQSLGGLLGPQQWELCTRFCLFIWRESQPLELLEPTGGSVLGSGLDQDRFSLDHTIIMAKSVLQLLLIDGISTSLLKEYSNAVPIKTSMDFLSQLESSFRFARLFNSQLNRRRKLQLKGFMASLPSLPGLIKQEKDSVTFLLRSLIQVTRSIADCVLTFKESLGRPTPSKRMLVAERISLIAQTLPSTTKSLPDCLTSRESIEVLWDGMCKALLDLIETLVSQYYDALDVIQSLNTPTDQSNELPMREYAKSEAEREISALHRLFEDVIIPELSRQPEVFFECYAEDIYCLFSTCMAFESPALRMLIRDVMLNCLHKSLFPKSTREELV